MKTYSKKASKHTECAERSSSSDDDRVGKEQPNSRKTPKRTHSSSEDDESDEKSRKRVEQIKINQPILRKKLRHKKENSGKGKFSSKSVDFLLTFY